jgi:hypothetical protein
VGTKSGIVLHWHQVSRNEILKARKNKKQSRDEENKAEMKELREIERKNVEDTKKEAGITGIGKE